MKLFCLIASLLVCLTATTPAHALTEEPGPVDSNDTQLTDPDDALDALADQTENGNAPVANLNDTDHLTLGPTGFTPTR